MYKVLNVKTNEEKRFNKLKEAFDYAIKNMPNSGYIRVFPLNGYLNFSSGINEYAVSNIEFKLISLDGTPFTKITEGLFGSGGKL